jgi:DNA polymerase-3 subunit beta
LPAEVKTAGSTTVPAHMIYDIVRKLPEGSHVELSTGSDHGTLAVKAGRSRFSLQTLPESDFPDLAAGDLPHKFSLSTADLKRLVDKTQFAISTEETRYYLNGIYLHAVEAKPAKLRAVATDGHRLAQVEIPSPKGADGMPGVIVPRKTVSELQKLVEDAGDEVEIELSAAKIRFSLGKVTLTSKLIDGTFPDYGRVIPAGNDKTLIVEKQDFANAVDRVSTVSSERGRAVKLSLASGKLTLSVTNPDSGSATEELEVDYSSDPLDIGFNSRYLLDIAAQLEGEKAELKLADPGSPTLLQDQDAGGALYVLMPMRV